MPMIRMTPRTRGLLLGASAVVTPFASWAVKTAKGIAARASEELEKKRQRDAEIRRERQAAAEEERQRAALAAAEEEAKRQKQEQLIARSAERWPERLFPRVPKEAMNIIVKDNPDGNLANLREDMFEIWESMLEAYPNPPISEEERKAREAQFWQYSANKFIHENADGRLYLEPKQEILDFFIAYEKWIFRGYYAATGLIIKTFYGEELIEHIMRKPASTKWLSYHEIPNKAETMSSVFAAYRKGYEKSWNEKNRITVERENDRHQQEANAYLKSVDAHREKWGEWYFFHVEQAFRTLTEEAAKAPAAVHGDAKLASEAEARAAAAGLRRQSLDDAKEP